jgi:hypothetical protein
MGMISGEETAVNIRQIEGKSKDHEVGSEFVSCTDGDGAAVRQRGPDFRPRLGCENGEVELRRMGLLAKQVAHLTIQEAKGCIYERGVQFPWDGPLPSPSPGGGFTPGDGRCGFISMGQGHDVSKGRIIPLEWYGFWSSFDKGLNTPSRSQT